MRFIFCFHFPGVIRLASRARGGSSLSQKQMSHGVFKKIKREKVTWHNRPWIPPKTTV